MSNYTVESATVGAQLLTRVETMAKLRAPLSTFAKLAKRPDFPTAIKRGRRTYYVEREIDIFIESLRQSAA